MCEYCAPDGAKIEMNSDRHSSLYVERAWNGTPILSFWTSLYLGELGDIDVEATADIEYCPMCGRKLREYE